MEFVAAVEMRSRGGTRADYVEAHTLSGRRTILVVDDDAHIRKVVRFALEREGYDVVQAADGQEALDQVKSYAPDLLVLDITMPKLNGDEVCRELRRADNQVPIIFLSSRNDEIDRILGLELGGDDYVTKPFSPRELVARIKAFFRRFDTPDPAPVDAADGELRHGQFRIDLEAYRAFAGDLEVKLTPTEFDILRRMVRRPSKVFSRADLMGDTIVSERTIDSHVRHIRKKFDAAGDDPIETVHGFGYKLKPAK